MRVHSVHGRPEGLLVPGLLYASILYRGYLQHRLLDAVGLDELVALEVGYQGFIGCAGASPGHAESFALSTAICRLGEQRRTACGAGELC
jgi:hypothetical protein